MIPRYTRHAMGRIWSEENKFRTWLEVEVLACEAQAELGVIPAEAVAVIRAKAAFDIARISQIEAEVQHDVIAFLTAVGEHVGPEARYIHYGMTSSDVLDTGLAVQMKQAGELLLDGQRKLLSVLRRRAKEFRSTIMVGRTHGVHAEPTSFGLKLALWHDETRRNIERLEHAVKTIAVGQISGAVGTFEHLDPRVEQYVCGRLGLAAAPVSTQVLQRDRHAEFLTAIAIAGCSLEKFSTEIRHLQKTEVREAEEYFSQRQKGSSAMPHKRNPITCERIAGLARILRGNAHASLENVALWHERDITHSSVERIIVPDSCILLDYMTDAFTRIMDKLHVYPEMMLRNLGLTRGLIFSQSVLLALTRRGMSREAAYALVQKHAMNTWSSDAQFRDLLSADPEVTRYLSAKDFDELFDLRKSLKHVNEIFARCGIE
ncbi:MAG TPA: adenylosuccinate lyase [Bacteroidota bacterium]|nr:adenylosuccinate lyase [Bacteroidota bacterium]